MEAIILDVTCPRCGLLFPDLASCALHSIHEHVEQTSSGRFQCIFCPSTLANMNSLRAHQWSEHVSTRSPYICKICDLEFASKASLDEHRAIHAAAGESVLKCPTCPRTFVSFRFLKQHNENYADETPDGVLPCRQCGKLFKQYNVRNQHEMHSHVAPYVYPCTFTGCTQGCPTVRALASHLKSHKKERSYKCPHCIRWFKEEIQLRRHATSLHPVNRPSPDPNKPFQCASCVKSFRKKYDLTQHVKRFHVQENSKWEKRHNQGNV